jgi:hypothetical protein
MDVTKAPPLDPKAGFAPTDGPTPQRSTLSAAAAATAPFADQVHIQPLDAAAALQILVAEVRADLGLPADAAVGAGPAQTAEVMIRLFLRALPADASNPSLWIAETERVDRAIQSALDRAVDAVAAWRNVPQSVVDVAKETRTLVTSLLSDAPPSPIWFRPEWLGLAPTIERFWRRRRLVRRGLADPDMRPSGGIDAADADAGFVDDKSQ